MSKISDEWNVLPHGPLTEVDDGIWTVTGEIKTPLTSIERRMTVVRLTGGGLVIYSAIALNDDEMKKLETLGRPAFLIVPGKFHRLDAPAWKRRYPTLQVIAPVGVRDSVEEVVRVDASHVDFGDDAVRLVTVGGENGFEAALFVRRATGTTLIVNDIIGNMPKESGLVLRFFKFAGDKPHVPLPIKFTLKDKEGLRDQLLSWADEPGLRRVLVSHGDLIESAVAEQLRALARTLQ